MRSLLLSFALLVGSLGAGCIVTTDDNPCKGGGCDTGVPTGKTYGKGADGRLAITAAQAWPARPTEPPALTVGEVAKACVALGSCLDPSLSPAALVGLCTLPDGAEERAEPSGEKMERRSFVLRAALATPTDCATLNAIETKRPKEIYCEEDGCWWSSASVPPPIVTCSGDVATLKYGTTTTTRDCARAYQHCDPTSSTGCTDRRPVACDPAASDVCDGNVKLGCDHAGRVSFHDCSRVFNGRCEEKSDGSAACTYPDAAKCTVGSPSTCAADGRVQVCVAGEQMFVDCTTLGFAKCALGRCVK